MNIYYEIDNFLEDLEIINSILTFKELRAFVGEICRYLQSCRSLSNFNFDNHRTAILIYLAQNYLQEDQREIWYNYYKIHLVRKNLAHTTINLTVNDHHEPEFSDDDEESISGLEEYIDLTENESEVTEEIDECEEIDAIEVIEEIDECEEIDASEAIDEETDTVEEIDEVTEEIDAIDPTDLDELDSLPEKIIAIDLPDHRHGLETKPQLIFDEDYDFYQSVHHLAPAIIEEIYQKNFESDLIHDLGYDRKYIVKRLNFYDAIPQCAQKSEEWLLQRTNKITASSLADALGKKGKQARQNLLLDKVSFGVHRTFFGNFYTRWGEKYEDICSTIYCNRLGVDLYDFGMLPHPKYKMLGASTDGISSKLINLEIKCPPTRQITGIIPKYYWMQIQLQLEVLNLPLSHFLECRIEEFASEEEFYQSFESNSNETGHEPSCPHPERGIVIEILDVSRSEAGLPNMTYRYSPIDLDPKGYREWHRNEIREILEAGLIYISDSYWYLEVYSCINVQRDFKWFQANLDEIFEFWKDVEIGREKGIEVVLEEVEKDRMPKSGISTEIPTDCLLDSDTDEVVPPKIKQKSPPKKSPPKSPPKKSPTKSSPKKSPKKKNIIHFELL